MNILHVLDGFHRAGIEMQAFEIINNFPKPKNKNFLINLNPNVQDIKEFKNLLQKRKILNIFDVKSKFSIIRVLHIYKFFKKNKINSVIIYPCNIKMLSVIIAAKLAGVNNIFIHIGNVIEDYEKYKLLKIKILFLILKYFGVFMVPASQSILKSMKKLDINFKKINVIYNSCDVKKIRKLADSSRVNRSKTNTKFIVMIARLDIIKDHVTLLKAFSRLNFDNWKLKIIGKGPNLDYLRKLSLRLSLKPEEIFVGLSENIPEILGKADIFAFSTTEAEGFGKVLIEAMAAEVPIIASDVSACREVLFNGKAGLLTEPQNIEAWEQNLKKLIKYKSERLKLIENGNQIVKLYKSKKIAKEWENLLKKELKSKF